MSDELDFNQLMTQLTNLDTKTNLIGANIGHGLLHIQKQVTELYDRVNDVTSMIQEMTADIAESLNEMLRNPIARVAFTGPSPDKCAYDNCRQQVVKLIGHQVYEFNLSYSVAFKNLYYAFCDRTNIDLVNTYYNQYIVGMQNITGQIINKKKISIIEVATQLGVVDDLYVLAWELTSGGTRRIPDCEYKPVDRSKYPVDLTPRGKRQGARLYPLWCYNRETVGRRKRVITQTTDSNFPQEVYDRLQQTAEVASETLTRDNSVWQKTNKGVVDANVPAVS